MTGNCIVHCDCESNHIMIDVTNSSYNRIIIIEYQQLRGIMKYRKCLSYTFPFYSTQIVKPFLNSRISANHDKGERLSANSDILIG